MSFWGSFRNIRYFFRWLAALFRTWFTPYHFDGDDESAEAATDKAPDRMPKPSVPPAEKTEATEADVAYAERPDTDALSDVMAFRGPMNKAALAAVLDKRAEDVEDALNEQLSYGTVEELDDGRYLLVEYERRNVLRADPNVSDWLARLQSVDLEENALEVFEQICRNLRVKILAGKSLVFHLRQRKWMVWQSHENVCRVRLFGTLNRDTWSHLREVDPRARRFHQKGRRGWNPNDSATFRWEVGADSLAIESVLLEAGRDFQKRVRRRRKSGQRPRKTPSQTVSG